MSIRETLEELYELGHCEMHPKEEIDQAELAIKAEILKEIREKMPKKKKPNTEDFGRDYGFNQALTEAIKVIEEVLRCLP
jgi:Glu-tRNA(Gln) amidotransferase subunit E-like FAD-binding protein